MSETQKVSSSGFKIKIHTQSSEFCGEEKSILENESALKSFSPGRLKQQYEAYIAELKTNFESTLKRYVTQSNDKYQILLQEKKTLEEKMQEIESENEDLGSKLSKQTDHLKYWQQIQQQEKKIGDLKLGLMHQEQQNSFLKTENKKLRSLSSQSKIKSSPQNAQKFPQISATRYQFNSEKKESLNNSSDYFQRLKTEGAEDGETKRVLPRIKTTSFGEQINSLVGSSRHSMSSNNIPQTTFALQLGKMAQRIQELQTQMQLKDDQLQESAVAVRREKEASSSKIRDLTKELQELKVNYDVVKHEKDLQIKNICNSKEFQLENKEKLLQDTSSKVKHFNREIDSISSVKQRDFEFNKLEIQKLSEKLKESEEENYTIQSRQVNEIRAIKENMDKVIQKQSKELQEAQIEKTQLERTLANIKVVHKKEIDYLQTTGQKKLDEVKEEFEEKIRKIQQEKDEIHAKMGKFEEENKENAAKLKEFKTEIQTSKIKSEIQEKELNSQIEEFKAEIQRLQKQKSENEEKRQGLEVKIEELSQKLGIQNRDIQRLNKMRQDQYIQFENQQNQMIQEHQTMIITVENKFKNEFLQRVRDWQEENLNKIQEEQEKIQEEKAKDKKSLQEQIQVMLKNEFPKCFDSTNTEYQQYVQIVKEVEDFYLQQLEKIKSEFENDLKMQKIIDKNEVIGEYEKGMDEVRKERENEVSLVEFKIQKIVQQKESELNYQNQRNVEHLKRRDKQILQQKKEIDDQKKRILEMMKQNNTLDQSLKKIQNKEKEDARKIEILEKNLKDAKNSLDDGIHLQNKSESEIVKSFETKIAQIIKQNSENLEKIQSEHSEQSNTLQELNTELYQENKDLKKNYNNKINAMKQYKQAVQNLEKMLQTVLDQIGSRKFSEFQIIEMYQKKLEAVQEQTANIREGPNVSLKILHNFLNQCQQKQEQNNNTSQTISQSNNNNQQQDSMNQSKQKNNAKTNNHTNFYQSQMLLKKGSSFIQQDQVSQDTSTQQVQEQGLTSFTNQAENGENSIRNKSISTTNPNRKTAFLQKIIDMQNQQKQ